MTDKEKIADLERRLAELEKAHEVSEFKKALKELADKLPPPVVPIYYPRYWPYYPPAPIYPTYPPNWYITYCGNTQTLGQMTVLEP